MSELWNAEYVGSGFFHMGLKDVQMGKEEHSEEAKLVETRSEDNPLFILDDDLNSRLTFVYNVGRAEYTDNVGTFLEQTMTVLPGAAVASRMVKNIIGGSKKSRKGKRCKLTRTNRHKYRVRKRLSNRKSSGSGFFTKK